MTLTSGRIRGVFCKSSHSAMRDFEFKVFDKQEPKVFPRIYRESYVNEIMNRIQENSSFGRYKNDKKS